MFENRKLKVLGQLMAVGMISFAYYTYHPLPDGVVQPTKQMIGGTLRRLVFDVADVLEKVGISSVYNTMRTLMSLAVLSLEDDELQITNEVFGGVAVRVYRPKKYTTKLPGLMYFHGGGWAIGNINVDDHVIRRIAKRTNVVVVSVEYRLAPEHPYPVPLNDCETATKYFMNNADKYNVDQQRIGVSGESAGGNLAMAVAARLSRDTSSNLPLLKLQALFCPALQMADFRLPSYLECGDRRFYLPRDMMVKFWVNYAFGKTQYVNELKNNQHQTDETKAHFSKLVYRSLLNKKERDFLSPKKLDTQCISFPNNITEIFINKEISPLLLEDKELSKLPKTYILTAEFDVLRDDSFILNSRLQSLGHHVVHKYWKGVQHGFMMDNLDRAAEAVLHLCDYLKHEL